MATVGTSNITLVDVKKTLDPDSKVAKIIEVLETETGLVMDMHWQEGNLDVGHRHTIRSGLPDATWRLLNYGVQPTKGRTKQVDDMCGMLEAICDIDKKIAELNGNKAAYRWTQDQAHIMGMNQDLETALIYGNQATDPEQITGLSPRYAAGKTDADSDTSADNVLNGGGTGSDNTSVWLVCHSPHAFFGIYPKGMKAGLQHDDRGIQDKTDSSGNIHRVYRSYYSWDCGAALADWQSCVRIANIDISWLIADAGTADDGADLIGLMVRAMHRIPPRLRNTGRMVFYGNETIETYLDLQTLKQSNMHVTYQDSPHGQPIMKFRGIPFHRSDALLEDESAVTFT